MILYVFRCVEVPFFTLQQLMYNVAPFDRLFFDLRSMLLITRYKVLFILTKQNFYCG